jgi:AcrR family transcriptional regulator
MSDTPRTTRARQAELTRQEILTAARRLFGEQGYSRTTVRDIATAAGVSSQTVYDSVGTKQAVVAQLNDLIDTEAGIQALAEAAGRSGDPLEVAALQARITRSIMENCGDVIRALVSGAEAEPELAAVLAEGHRRHVEGARTTVALLQKLGALDEAVGHDEAVDTLSVTSDVRLALVLQEGYGWSLDRIESWITATTRMLLLA